MIITDSRYRQRIERRVIRRRRLAGESGDANTCHGEQLQTCQREESESSAVLIRQEKVLSVSSSLSVRIPESSRCVEIRLSRQSPIH